VLVAWYTATLGNIRVECHWRTLEDEGLSYPLCDVRRPASASGPGHCAGIPLGLVEDGRTDPVHTVAELLPDGYAMYLRIFHPFLPADPANPESTLPGPARTWRSLAEEVGAVYHAEIMWGTLIDALGGWESDGRPYWVSEGYLHEPVRSALIELLADGLEVDTYFLFELAGLMFSEGHRPVLYRAALRDHRLVQAAAEEVIEWVQSGPEFLWPLDRSWVLNTDYDLASSYLACNVSIAQRVLDSPLIEALPVSRATRVDDGADRINADRKVARDQAG
jgi:hypothetical protein